MRKRTVADVDWQLRVSSGRALKYNVRGDTRSLWIERWVQDRLLDERNELTAVPVEAVR